MSSTSHTPAAKPGLFSSAARKAHVAAAIAFLSTLLTFFGAENWRWDWTAFVPALLAAVVAGLGVYQTSNAGTVYLGSDRAH